MLRSNALIDVLVVDDSAFMRKAISRMLESDPEIRVAGVARDGEEAVRLVKRLKPHLVTLDLEMPRMGGLEALKIIMEENPTPVIILSSLSEEGAQVTLDAMELGALDFVPKNLGGTILDVMNIERNLQEKVKIFAGKKISRLKTRKDLPDDRSYTLAVPKSNVPAGARMTIQKTAVIAIGTSTGGPKALQEVLPRLPKDFPAAVLVVQHMPKAFTGPFAERMNALCHLNVKEASDGDVVTSGQIYIAPGSLHMKVVKRKPTEINIEITKYPEELLYKPSADVMMESVALVYPARSIGVIMTGMGADGLKGMLAIKKNNGRTIAQDEASCVVYGMPRAVVEAHAADKIVPLSQIAGEIMNMV